MVIARRKKRLDIPTSRRYGEDRVVCMHNAVVDTHRLEGARMRLPVDLNAEVVRALTPEDMEALEQEREIKAPAIKRLSERHHALARCLADGMAPWQAAIHCSYSASRISILQADPTFNNLIEAYRANIDVHYYDPHQRLAVARNLALDEIIDRLEEQPEKVRFDQLIEVGKFASDRSGFGPSSTNLNVQVDMATKLGSARRRAIEAKRIEAERTLPPVSDREPVAVLGGNGAGPVDAYYEVGPTRSEGPSRAHGRTGIHRHSPMNEEHSLSASPCPSPKGEEAAKLPSSPWPPPSLTESDKR